MDETRWIRLVDRIRASDPAATEELYGMFSRGVRFYLYRHLGLREIDDKVHDLFLIILQAIHTGELREPDRLMGYIRTVVRRQTAGYIIRSVKDRKEQVDLDPTLGVIDESHNPEESAIWDQHAKLMRELLASVPGRDREILTRFYIQGQAQEEICEKMGLSITQFRLLKSRAKARFGELSRRKLLRRPLLKFFMRKTAGQ